MAEKEYKTTNIQTSQPFIYLIAYEQTEKCLGGRH